MIDPMLYGLTFLLALGCGLVAGVFFAFSTFVMKALARLPAPQGIAAMQTINITVINPWFLSLFLGTVVGCALVLISLFWRWGEPGVGYLLGGALTYFVGTFLVTVRFNIPRNDALANVDPESADGARLWGEYLTSWTNWNHMRTLAGLAASALLTLALWR